MIYYIITAIIGVFLGIVLASILSAAKRADEWSEAYRKGYNKGKTELLNTPVKSIISVENYGLVPFTATVCVPSEEVDRFPEAVKEAVNKELVKQLAGIIKGEADYAEIYDPVHQRVEYRASVKIAKRRN